MKLVLGCRKMHRYLRFANIKQTNGRTEIGNFSTNNKANRQTKNKIMKYYMIEYISQNFLMRQDV